MPHIGEFQQPTRAPIVAITVGASPFTYKAPLHGVVAISGGTVSALAFVRDGTSISAGAVAGMFPLAIGDSLTVTYTVAPTMSFIPR